MERNRSLAALRARVRPPRTVRLRLTLLYGAVVLVSGVALLAVTFLLGGHRSEASYVSIAVKASGSLPGLTSGQVAGRVPPAGAVLGGGVVRAGGGASGSSSSSGLSIKETRKAVETASSDTIHNLAVWSGAALGIITVLGLGVGWVVSGRMLRPLRAMTATTQQISEANLHERLALAGPSGDELKELGDTIDGLLGRLESAFDAQGRFVQNASHELRTPIAMMRTSLEVATGKPGGTSTEVAVLATKLQEGLDQAERLLESFLLLAHAQQGDLSEQSVVSLADAASDALALQRDAIDRLGLEIRLRLGEAPVQGSATLLARMVANLVDNAVRHNEPGAGSRSRRAVGVAGAAATCRGSSWRTAVGSSSRRAWTGSASRSDGSLPSAPGPRTAWASGSRSSPRSRARTAAASSSPPEPAGDSAPW